MEKNNTLDCRLKARRSAEKIKSDLLSSEEFKELLKTLTLDINDLGKIVICNLEGKELGQNRLSKTFSVMRAISNLHLSYMECLELLRDFIYSSLDYAQVDLLDLKIENYKKGLSNEDLELRIKVSTILDTFEDDFITYSKLCEKLNENYDISLTENNPKLSNVLRDLGYEKKRKVIDSKKVTIWVKNN